MNYAVANVKHSLMSCKYELIFFEKCKALALKQPCLGGFALKIRFYCHFSGNA